MLSDVLDALLDGTELNREDLISINHTDFRGMPPHPKFLGLDHDVAALGLFVGANGVGSVFQATCNKMHRLTLIKH